MLKGVTGVKPTCLRNVFPLMEPNKNHFLLQITFIDWNLSLSHTNMQHWTNGETKSELSDGWFMPSSVISLHRSDQFKPPSPCKWGSTAIFWSLLFSSPALFCSLGFRLKFRARWPYLGMSSLTRGSDLWTWSLCRLTCALDGKTCCKRNNFWGRGFGSRHRVNHVSSFSNIIFSFEVNFKTWTFKDQLQKSSIFLSALMGGPFIVILFFIEMMFECKDYFSSFVTWLSKVFKCKLVVDKCFIKEAHCSSTWA